MSAVHPEPSGVMEQIADAAILLVLDRLSVEGLTVEHVFVTFNVKEKDGDGENATSAFHAEGDSDNLPDLLGFLLAQAKGIAQKLGLTISVLDGRGKRVGHG